VSISIQVQVERVAAVDVSSVVAAQQQLLLWLW
jgi:hypothetical protein